MNPNSEWTGLDDMFREWWDPKNPNNPNHQSSPKPESPQPGYFLVTHPQRREIKIRVAAGDANHAYAMAMEVWERPAIDV